MTSIAHSNGATAISSKGDAEQQLWDSYNHLMMSPDVERLRKVFAREELFRRTIDIPGDIVECGVFKGLLCKCNALKIIPGRIRTYGRTDLRST